MTTATNVPQTAEQAQQMLRALKLPEVDAHTLSRISRDEGPEFKQAIASAASATPEAPASLEYLLAVFTSYSPAIAAAIRTMGYEPAAPQGMIATFKQEGKPVRAALRALIEGRAEPGTREYLQRVFNVMGLKRLPASTAGTNNASALPAPLPRQTATQGDSFGDPEPPENDQKTFSDNEVAGQQKDEKKIESVHLYAGKAAFCFTKDITQTGGFPTVTVDAARVFPGQEKNYDWKNKIIIQLTVGELALVYGVFYGYLKEIRLMGHGRANNKSLTIEDQGKNYFLSMQMGKEPSIAIPAIPKDAFRLMGLLKKQINANFPELDWREVELLMRRVCEKHAAGNTQQMQSRNAA